MPAPVYVAVDSSYKPKRNMVKKYAASAARAKQNPNATGNSFYSAGNSVVKARPAHLIQPMYQESERGGQQHRTEQKIPRERVADVIPDRDSEE